MNQAGRIASCSYDEEGKSSGPLFRIILDKIEEAQMERAINTRAEALALAAAIAVNPIHNAAKSESSSQET